MQFKEVPVCDALGWSLAHSIDLDGKRIAKNTEIDPALVAQMRGHGVNSVLAFRLEEGDVDENSAAYQIARHLVGSGLAVRPPSRGRCNIHTVSDGVLLAPPSLNTLNGIEPAVGVATLPNLAPVRAGKLVATVKIIPYGVAAAQVEAIKAVKTKLSVRPYKGFSAALISTGKAMSAKAVAVTRNRINAVGGELGSTENCAHTVKAVAGAIAEAASHDNDLILLSGISAISDRRDILPSALEEAGGEVLHLGMPVDPGNLLMLGNIGDKTVIGMPGCAKSPSLNGFDWVLERYAANMSLNSAALQAMGIGGLLKETIERPQPRAPGQMRSLSETVAIVLAAGTSSRSGATHKLLASLDNKPVIEQSVNALREAGFEEIIVVTGSRADEIKSALGAQAVTVVHNPDFASGMASSLAAGVAALPAAADQTVISLGDMPFVASRTYHALIEAANNISEAEIFTPRYKGKRGNPVLWRRSQFEKLKSISGDKGGRILMREQEGLVCDVPVEDPGILIDLDTPEALAQFGIKVTD